MLRRMIAFAVGLPLGVVLVTLAVINRQSVTLILDPFHPEAPVLSVVLPLYAYLFGALLLGIMVGGGVVWVTQGAWRRAARRRAAEAQRWRAELQRLERERHDGPARRLMLASKP